jgi:hypothetical protein
MRVVIALLVITFTSAGWAADAWIGVNSTLRGAPTTVEAHRSANNCWTMDVSIPGFEVVPAWFSGQPYDVLSLPNESFRQESGEPEVPALTRMIGLQLDGNPTLEVVSEEWTDLEGSYHLAAVDAEGGAITFAPSDAYEPEAPYVLSSRQVMGGVALTELQIAAAKYNPVQHKIRVLRSLTLRVHEHGAPVVPDRGITETIAQCLRPLLVNWDELALDELVVRGTFLYVLADASVAPTQIQPLVTWRTRKGYRVEVAGPAEIGNPLTVNNIKTYIQQRYNNANPPLEFVCMVGDGNGAYVVPSYSYTDPANPTHVGAGDFGYTQLDGGDLLPDIAMGRIYFSITPEILTQINKILRYEQIPAARNLGSHPNWYKAGAVEGDYDNQAMSVSHIQTMRWVRERMLDAGYTNSSIDTLYYINYGNVPISPSLTIASINSGGSLWCYRGWNRMNTLPVSDVQGLNNVGDWPFMLTMTCNTNDFDQTSGPCLGEAFMVPNATPTNPAGAIGFIGMSSGGTHTRFNNILMGGAVQGILREGIHTEGGTLIRAKLELHRNYPSVGDSEEVRFFCGITSLLGDPGTDVYTDTPDTLQINNPSSVSVGTNSLTLVVTRPNGTSVDSAYVNLVKGTEVFAGGYTDHQGTITLNFRTTTADTLFITATKHNYLPAIRYALVTASSQYVSPATTTFTLDDDNTGSSQGNGDGHANPSETIELAVPLKNWGTTTVTNVTATLSTTDPYIITIGDNTESYGTIAAGATVPPGDDFDFTVAPFVPDGHTVQFTLTAMDNAGHQWTSAIPIPLTNGALSYVGATLLNVGNGVLDPNESGQMYITLLNSGLRALATGKVAYLRSLNPQVTVTDSVGIFSALAVNGQGSNQSNTFGVSAPATAIPGERAQFLCTFPLADGFSATVNFSVVIGNVASTSPTPCDAYGYRAFDNTDVAYDKHPTYNWVEVDPDSGGAGTQLPLVDNHDGGDASMVVSLPWDFQYYGEEFDHITVCTNGWLAMGADQAAHMDFRNYTIPSAMGASALIAPFWDDLWTSQPLLASQADAHGGNENSLDSGGEGCSTSTVISSLPYSDSDNTCWHQSGACSNVGNSSQDVFYKYTVPAGGQTLRISLCGSQFDTRLIIWGTTCCSSGVVLACDTSSCPDGTAQVTQYFAAGNIWIMIEGVSMGPGITPCGDYNLAVTQFTPQAPGHVCTYNDAANHRFIVEWSRVFKYNGIDNPTETFEAILYRPGYPSTPTGDGEILFQYKTCVNAVDVTESNDYATVGIENLDQTDGVLYSYRNQINPTIPGAATMTSGRAVLFTTARTPPDLPQTPGALTVYNYGTGVRLLWRPVSTDVQGNPLTNIHYNIYRGTQVQFVPDASNLLATVTDTNYVDNAGTGTLYFYIVRAETGEIVAAPARIPEIIPDSQPK